MAGESTSTRQSPKSADERLMVVVRVRPLKPDEQYRSLHVIDEKTVVLANANAGNPAGTPGSTPSNTAPGGGNQSERRFSFDAAFNEEATQEAVYSSVVAPLVKDALAGYRAAVLAYGPTGTGKTHTMAGDVARPGCMVRALDELFKGVESSKHPERYEVKMSCLEIYNEQIRDLLNPASGYLELREDAKGRNIQVAGITEIDASSTDQVMLLLDKANKARTVEPTAMNKTSSRSHAMVTVTIKYTTPLDSATLENPRSRVRMGKLVMIDLAGSERANKTKNRGKRLQEGAHINRSLLALANCINALSDGARYVNYRDSKLTRLLKDTLSGNCRTVMIAHVSPAKNQRDETRNTLIYAERAKKIQTKSEIQMLDVGYQVTQYHTVINELRNEITRLRNKMQEERPRSGKAEKLTSAQKNTEVKSLREQIVATFKEQMRLRRKLMEIDSQLLGLGMDSERQHMVISNWESRNNKLYKKVGTARLNTQQSFRRKNTSDSGSGSGDADSYISDTEVDGENAVSQAWSELAYIEKEQERWQEERQRTEQELEAVRQHGISLEDELPSRISTDDERELLALLCRVHELEADKMALQGERIARMHELRRRDTALLRSERQRQISDAIITRQRQLMEEMKIHLPPDLVELYQLYQQEIHAATYAETNFGSFNFYDKMENERENNGNSYFTRKRSPESDYTVPSSADSDYALSPLPPVNETTVHGAPVEDRLMGQLVPPPSRGIRFPPISAHSLAPSRLPRPVTNYGGYHRTSSDEDMVTADH